MTNPETNENNNAAENNFNEQIRYAVTDEKPAIPEFNSDNADLSSMPQLRPMKTFKHSQRFRILGQMAQLESVQNDESIESIVKVTEIAENTLMQVAEDPDAMEDWIKECEVDQLLSAFAKVGERVGKLLKL